MEVTVDIAVPADDVWPVLADIEHWPDWLPTVTAAKWSGDGPTEVGRKARLTQPRLGTATWTVTDYRQGRSFAWSRSSPGVTTHATHAITSTDSGCRVTLGMTHVGPLAPLTRLVTSTLTRKYVGTEAASLKRRCEQD